jgi:hypothetical protein
MFIPRKMSSFCKRNYSPLEYRLRLVDIPDWRMSFAGTLKQKKVGGRELLAPATIFGPPMRAAGCGLLPRELLPPHAAGPIAFLFYM